MASPGPGYLDPDLIYALFYNRRLQDMLKYLDSIPGSSDDPSCRTIRAMGELLLPNPVRGFVPVRDGPVWYHQNAMVAQSLAQTSRFLAGGIMNDLA